MYMARSRHAETPGGCCLAASIPRQRAENACFEVSPADVFGTWTARAEYQDFETPRKNNNGLVGFNGVAWRGPEERYLPKGVSGDGCAWGYLHPKIQGGSRLPPAVFAIFAASSLKKDFRAISCRANASFRSADPLKQIPCIRPALNLTTPSTTRSTARGPAPVNVSKFRGRRAHREVHSITKIKKYFFKKKGKSQQLAQLQQESRRNRPDASVIGFPNSFRMDESFTLHSKGILRYLMTRLQTVTRSS